MSVRVQLRPLLAFLGFWALGAVVFSITYLANPPRLDLKGSDAYGTTTPGELGMVLRITMGEALVAATLLQPWSYRNSWQRAGLALIPLTVWVLIWGALGLHSGPTTFVHLIWLSLFWLGLLAILIAGPLGDKKQIDLRSHM